MTPEIYRAGTLKRIRRTGSQTNQLDAQILDVLIDVALERELRLHLNDSIGLEFDRIAINDEQIEAYDLPTKPRKAGDKRSQHIEYSVEAEAMPAADLRRLLRWNIEILLPENALAVATAAEESERAHLTRMAELLGADDGEI